MHPLANAGLSASAVTVLTWGLSLYHVTIPADVTTALVALVAAAVHATGLIVGHYFPAKASVVTEILNAAPAVLPEAPAVSPVNPSNIAAGH
jgi:hypothetical protein